MKISRHTPALITTILFVLLLFLSNRDIFRFEYHDPHHYSFSPEDDAKGFSFLGNPILLKKGAYRIIFTGDLPEMTSGITLVGDNDEELYSESFWPEGNEAVFDVTLPKTVPNARIRLNYDPKSGPLEIEHILITGDHLVYRETVLYHAIRSLLLAVLYFFVLLRICRPDLFFRIFSSFRDPKNEQAFILLLLLTAFVSVPWLLPERYILGNDTLFHLSRLNGVAADLKAGIFPARIELFWMGNVGYGVGFFYPEIFLVIPALFLIAGFPLLSVYRAVQFLTVFCILAAHYSAARTLSKGDHRAGIAAAVFIALAIYRLQNQYIRDGLGENIATVFLPLIVSGLYQVFHRKPGGCKILAFGFSGALLSHSLSFVLAVILTAIFLLTQIVRIWKEKGIAGDILKAACISVCFTAFFLFPMLEQKFAVPDLKINQVTSGRIDISYATCVQPVSDLLMFYQPADVIIAGLASFFPGWALLAVPLLGIFLRKQRSGSMRTAHILSIAAVLILAASTDLFPWHRVQFFLNDIQFSWRLLQSTAVLLSLAGGIYVSRLCENRSPGMVISVQLLFCLIQVIPFFFSLKDISLKFTRDFYFQDNHTYGSEYMPPQLTRKYLEKNDRTITDAAGRAVFSGFRRKGLSLEFDFVTDHAEAISFTVPFIYYKGYAAEIKTADGETQGAGVSAADNGLVRVQTGEAESGHIRVWYRGTAVQTISDILSLLSVCGYILHGTLTRRKKTVGPFSPGTRP